MADDEETKAHVELAVQKGKALNDALEQELSDIVNETSAIQAKTEKVLIKAAREEKVDGKPDELNKQEASLTKDLDDLKAAEKDFKDKSKGRIAAAARGLRQPRP